MNVLVGGKDPSELVETITWSGNSGQVTRKLELTTARGTQGPNFPNVTINEGDQVFPQTDMGASLLGGIIFDIEKVIGSNLARYLIYDLILHLTGSGLTKDYSGAPESAARDVCGVPEITAGMMVAMGITITNPCIEKTGYQVIQSSYTATARKNGKEYQLVMTEVNRASVVEGDQDSGVILTGGPNPSGATHKATSRNLVSKVLITNQKGTAAGVMEDTESWAAYGTIQKTLEQEEGKNVVAKAENSLHGSDPSTMVTGIPDDIRAIVGYVLLVQEEETGLIGQLFVEGDSHKYSNGESTMSLTLALQSLMNEAEIDKLPENKKQKREG